MAPALAALGISASGRAPGSQAELLRIATQGLTRRPRPRAGGYEEDEGVLGGGRSGHGPANAFANETPRNMGDAPGDGRRPRSECPA